MTKQLTFRMVAPLAGLSLLLLAAAVGTAWYVHAIQRDIATALESNVSSIRAAEELEIAVRELRTQVYYYLLTRDRHHLDQANHVRTEVSRWLAVAVRWATTEKEQALMDRVSQGVRNFHDALDSASGSQVSAEQLKRLTDEILEPTHAYLDFNEEELEKTSQANRIHTNRLIFSLLLLGICGSAAGLLAGLGLARAVSRSLVQLSVPLRAAAGQLDEVAGPVTFTAPWDLSQLEEAFGQIAGRIGDIIGRLRQSEREALRAEQLAAVGQMAAGMAHELRNPLMAMKILVQAALAREGGEGCLRGRDLAVLEAEITRLEGVTQSLLQFARPPQPEKRPVEAGPLIEASVALLAARADLCQIRIRAVLPESPVTVLADSGQLRQVLLNLLLNALEAVPPRGEIQIELTEEPTGHPGERDLCIRVRDTGTGLPANLGPRIFAPFVSTKGTGLGLGLSICKRIAEMHGGSIEAENRPTGGAVFTLRLPLPGLPAGAAAALG